jgi:hypothetical protein
MSGCHIVYLAVFQVDRHDRRRVLQTERQYFVVLDYRMVYDCHVYLVVRLMLGMGERIGMELDQACMLSLAGIVDVKVGSFGL